MCKQQNLIKPAISLGSFKGKLDLEFVQSSRW